jgi:hypothetical protein
MKRIIFASIAISFFAPALSLAAGPFSSVNFTGTDVLQTEHPSVTFEEFYKPNTSGAAKNLSLPQDVAQALESELQPSEFERAPASVQPNKSKVAARFPSNVSEGFEYKVKIGNRLTAFWVVKRGNQHELIFANNAGSKASFTIPVEHFYQLNTAARGVRAPASDAKTCKEGYVRMQFYDETPQKTITTCLNLKKAAAVKQLGAVLSSYVR